MRILTFLHSFEPGGVERVALRLVRRWRALGVDAPLFIGRDEGALHHELAHDLDFSLPPRTGWWSRPLETPWMIARLPAEIRRTRPDILFCSGNTYTVVCVMMKLLLRDECPPILAKISNDLDRPDLPQLVRAFHRLWARIQARHIDGWVVMHPAMRRETEQTIGAVPLSVIPDPALTTAQLATLRQWRPRSGAPSGRRFVAVGRLVSQKNYPLMLRAFAAAAAAGDTLTIYGEGPDRRVLERLAGTLGITGRMCFAGHVHDAAQCLLDQDVLLLSSRYEGVPAALVEGLACGMPIIATDCGAGVRGLLAGYDRVTLVDSGDDRGFTQAVGLASAAPPSAAHPSDIPERFTIEVGASAYLDAFAATIRSHSAEAVGSGEPAFALRSGNCHAAARADRGALARRPLGADQ